VDQPTLNLKDSAPKKNPSSVLHRVAKGGSERFDLLPAELSLNFVVKNPGSMDYRLEKLLENIRTKYEYVFIDCAPTDSVLTTMALTASDYILIPMKPDRYSILGFTNLMETVKNFRTGSHDPHSVKMAGVVFTQVHDDSSVEKKAMDEVSKVAKDAKVPLFTSFLPFSPSFMRSVEDQTPIYKTYKAKPRIRKAIASVAAEMVSEIAAINAAKTTAAGQIPAKKAKKS
jgi:chromosome partitioning protein